MATFAGQDSKSTLTAYDAFSESKPTYGTITIPPGTTRANEVAPTISNLAPAAGTTLASRQTPITFDVADTAPGLRVVVITLRYVALAGTFVVHNGSAFLYPFDGVSTRSPITGGYTFSVLPRGGWAGDIEELRVYAVDQAGNMEGTLP